MSYSTNSAVARAVRIAYCNLFNERRYGPYLNNSDTAKQYNEGQIDPQGAGLGMCASRSAPQQGRV